MIPVPMREVYELDGRDIRPESLDIPLPHIFFGARVEEQCVSLVSFYACLTKRVQKAVKQCSILICVDFVELTIINDKP